MACFVKTRVPLQLLPRGVTGSGLSEIKPLQPTYMLLRALTRVMLGIGEAFGVGKATIDTPQSVILSQLIDDYITP